jgi:hypothetical protein
LSASVFIMQKKLPYEMTKFPWSKRRLDQMQYLPPRPISPDRLSCIQCQFAERPAIPQIFFCAIDRSKIILGPGFEFASYAASCNIKSRTVQ